MATRGLDYSGGVIDGATIKQSGYAFVCRYLSNGAPKQITRAEADNLRANGIAIVSNWEEGMYNPRGGHAQGVTDANAAVNAAFAAGAPRDNPIYFSVDWDAQPNEYQTIFDYLDGAADVIGHQNVGVYGGYNVVKAALDAGKATWAWQTIAWSQSNVDPRIHILQTDVAYGQHVPVVVGGVDCDIDEARQTNFGQWAAAPSPGGGLDPAAINSFKAAFMGPVGSDVKDVREQLCGAGSRDKGQYTGWPQLGGYSVVDALATICNVQGIPTGPD